VSLDSRRFVFGSVGHDEYLYWSGRWMASNGLKRYILPSFVKETPEYIDTRRNLLITRVYGKRTLWYISEGIPRIMWKGVGNLMIDPWEGNWIRITVPGVPVMWHDLKREIPQAVGVVEERFAKSADGTEVPFHIVSHVSKPKALFISAYSAYGISTGFSTARWVPLLTEGFAVCFGLYRGGGDHTPEWEDDGRLGGRMKVLEDAEAVVREARRIYHIPASKTVIYGRSAGGLWVGGLCSRYPKGDLFGGAYMEVPYLDVLRTTTNHRLPLTFLETDEFGLPSLRISDFAGILQWSPMETLPVGGTDIFQIVRTGLNDPQVFAYESAKWVERNRRNSRVYLAIEGDQGHFVNGPTGLRQKAEDLSVIFDLIKKLKT
jgi:protease II